MKKLENIVKKIGKFAKKTILVGTLAVYTSCGISMWKDDVYDGAVVYGYYDENKQVPDEQKEVISTHLENTSF